MKRYLWFACLLSLLSCGEDDENYPIAPEISRVKVQFSEGIRGVAPDTLVVTFSFTDGDGDMGLDYQNNASDSLSPYHPWILFKRTGEAIPSEKLFTGEVSIDELIRLSDKQNPPYDTLPGRDSWCYDQFPSLHSDPPYCVPNENYYNILVDFFYEDPNGIFVEYDWYQQFCFSFNGRFSGEPGEDGPFLLKLDNAKKGQLSYRMTSYGFAYLFSDMKLKLRVYMKDRALHNSNAIETAPFFLTDI